MRSCVNTSFYIIAKTLEWLTWTLPEAASMRGLDLSSFCDFGHFQKAVLLPSSWCSRILLHVHVLQSFHVEWFWQLQDAGLLACTSLVNAVFVALAQLAVSLGLDVYYQVTAKRVNCHLKRYKNTFVLVSQAILLALLLNASKVPMHFYGAVGSLRVIESLAARAWQELAEAYHSFHWFGTEFAPVFSQCSTNNMVRVPTCTDFVLVAIAIPS